MGFRYRRYEIDPTSSARGVRAVYRPVIPVRVSGISGTSTFYALLDSGADETCLPRHIAEAVGVSSDLFTEGFAQGASGDLPVRYGKATLEVKRGKQQYRWSTIVGIIDQPWETMVLGQLGFLEYFNVTFAWSKKEVSLKRNRIPFEE